MVGEKRPNPDEFSFIPFLEDQFKMHETLAAWGFYVFLPGRHGT